MAEEEDPLVEADEEKATDEPTAEVVNRFIVVHHNEHGVHFATRVEAADADAAKAAVTSAHTDNTIVDVTPDHGESTHGLGGSILSVVDLDDEP